MRKKRWFKFLKWFVGIFLGLVLLISGGLYFFKDEIINALIGEVNKKLQTRVQVQEVDLTFWSTFPDLSVNFDEVFIQDTILGRFPTDTLFYSKQIQLRLNPIDIWNEEYRLKSVNISSGTFRMRVDENGNNNYSILEAKKDSLPDQEFNVDLEQIQILGLNYSYENEQINQFYSARIHDMSVSGALSNSSFTASAKSDMTIQRAQSGEVNLVRDKKVLVDMSIAVNQDSSSVVFPESNVSIAGLPFIFSGEVYPESYNFSLQGKQIKLQDVANNLAIGQTNSIKKFSGSGNLLFDLKIDRNKEQEERPNIACNFSIENGSLREPNTKVSLKKIQLNGKYRKGQRIKDELLDLNQLSFISSVGAFTGNLKISNFIDPIFLGKVKGSVELPLLHAFFHLPKIETMTGQIDVDSDFKLQSKKTKSRQNDFVVKRCTGNLSILDASFSLVNDSRNFKNINGDFYLRNNRAGFKSLEFLLGQSQVNLSGIFQNIVPFLRGQGMLFADVQLDSKKLITEDFESKIQSSGGKKLEVVDPKTFVLPQNIDGKAQVNIGQVQVGKHNFDGVKGKLRLSKRLVDLQSIRFSHAGAPVSGSLKIAEVSPEYLNLSGKMATRNADIQSIMKEWDGFEQTVILPKNIEGKADLTLDLKAPISLEKGVINSGVKAKVDVTLKNGRLKNVALFQEVAQSARKSAAKLLLGKKNIDYIAGKLTDLRFKTLKNSFTIDKGVVTMPKMNIESSALNLTVAGTHTFANEIDYRMSFRFKDLKRPPTSEFGVIEDDGTGIWIYLKMTGTTSSPIISWDSQSKKESRKEYNQKEKETLKSMLKSELGLFKNDSAVNSFQPKERPKDVIEVEFDPTSTVDPEDEESKNEQKKKNPLFEKWEKEKSQEEEEEIEIDWE